jgi:hypothetical protein
MAHVGTNYFVADRGPLHPDVLIRRRQGAFHTEPSNVLISRRQGAPLLGIS